MIKYIHDAMAKKREALENEDKGFSLIELLVVVLILGILAAIAIPVFIGQQNQAEDAGAKANLANAKVAIISYLVTHPALPSGDGEPAASLVEYGWPQGGATVDLAEAADTPDGAAWCLEATGNETFHVTDIDTIDDGACSDS